jgi:hypothetical protein
VSEAEALYRDGDAFVGTACTRSGWAHGVSMAVMSDSAGVFGVTSTSQILDPQD